MTANEIIELLETRNYCLEHFVDDFNGEITIVGHLTLKGSQDGLDRHEFALKDKKEQKLFLEGLSNYLKSVIG